ncbi:MAG TPA: thioredoxin domain-containing protein [Terriglobales bacterium]|nr:thioredoxin domain-containing protein [Terriglobales bacterium]
MKHDFCIPIVAIALTTSAWAQTQPSNAAKAQAKPTAAAATPAAKTELPSEDTVNSFLYQMFGYEATITWKITEIRPSEAAGLTEVTVIITSPQGSNANKLYVTADGKHAISGDILPFGAKPFEDARAKLEKGINGAAKGPAKAPVMIVEFSDMQCPHCKQAEPNVEQLLAQEPDVHFVFQNFPLPVHNWSEKAAGYVDCVGRASNDAVWKFIQKTFDEQSNITEANADEKLKAIATDSGVKADEIAACAAKPETKARIVASVALGKSVGVTGTPTLFINGRALNGAAPVDLLKKVVEFQANQGKEGKREASN